MSQLAFGLYEQIINDIINDNLNKIDNELIIRDTEPIDAAESSKILADYIAHILREVLEYIEDSEKAIENRTSLCNSIIRHITDCIEKGKFNFKKDENIVKRLNGLLIHQNTEILLALLEKRKAKVISSDKAVRPSTSIAENSLFTGALHEPSMVSEMRKEILSSDRIDFLVSFIKWSGLNLIMNELSEFTKNGGKLRVITTSYLGATDFKAVEFLGKLPNTEVRISYDTERTRLHAKTYVFWRDTGFSTAYIGSSNISESAMTSGLEWNIKLSQYDSGDILDKIYATFEGYWNSAEFVRFIPGIDTERLRKALKYERVSSRDGVSNFVYNFDIKPYYYQQEILDKLKAERVVHGLYKNLVVAATGTGKTVIAAFDYRDFCRMNQGKLNRLLFVAHRKEILVQSLACFRGILKDLNFGSIMVGGIKPDNLDHLFVSIQSFNSKDLISATSSDYYDYIVIDEFHHAVAGNYMNIIEYFKPKFLLGLTATPERLDNKDVFALCEYNKVYEVRLKEAINKGWLVPFRYYGVYDDETDYSSIDYRNGRYDEEQLERALNVNKRADLILQNYLKYSSKRALGFCTSRGHAVFMARYFEDHGVKSCAVISGKVTEKDFGSDEAQSYSFILDRKDAIDKLKRAEINIIFSVDMFNEGVDVPEVEMVMFLRPTESPTVFFQQLGRGLRKKGNKKYVNVLDFIGNYKNVIFIPFFLTGESENLIRQTGTIRIPEENEYPEGCIVNFDFRVIDLFKRIAESQKELFDRVKEEYFRIKEYIAAKPLRLPMYTYMDESIYSAVRTKKDLNIFNDYLSFLDKIGELSEYEKELLGTKAHEFLKEIENTKMSKLYKMPLLLAFYNNGEMTLSIDEDRIYKSFREFYSKASNAIDLLRDKSTRSYKEWGSKEYVSLAWKNPVSFFIQSSPEFFYKKDRNFCINPALEKYISNPAFIRHFKDIIDYRTRRFYKERLEKRLQENEPDEEDHRVRFALRDEFINIMAMTEGELPGNILTKY